MLRTIGIFTALLVASLILLVSIFKSAIPVYNYTQATNLAQSTQEEKVEYSLPYPGDVLPGNVLWLPKVFRDWFWVFVNRNNSKRSELYLLYANKRLRMAQSLIRAKDANLGIPTALKAEQYLQNAYDEQETAAKNGTDTGDLLEKLANASLKHKEVLEFLMDSAPEDARPRLNEIIDIPRRIYDVSILRLSEKNRHLPPTPLP